MPANTIPDLEQRRSALEEELLLVAGMIEERQKAEAAARIAAIPDEQITLSQVSADYGVPLNVLSNWLKRGRLHGEKQEGVRGRPVMVSRREAARACGTYTPGQGKRSDLIPA